jgi:hypothetical protein
MGIFTAYFAGKDGHEFTVGIDYVDTMTEAIAEAGAWRDRWAATHGLNLGPDAISATPVRIVDEVARVAAEDAAAARRA